MKLIALSLALIFVISGCAHHQQVDSSTSTGERLPAQYKQTDEYLISVAMPLENVVSDLQKMVETSTILKKLDYIRLDPQTRVLSMKGTVHYSLNSLLNFGDSGIDAPQDHDFEVALGFPSAREISQSAYLRLKFLRFRLNGDDMLNAFSVVAGFIQTVMANSELVKFLYDKAESGIKDPDSMTMMREILANNGFIINATTKTMAVKLKVPMIQEFKMYERYKDVRFWSFSPDLLGGTKDFNSIRIVVGLGKPSDKWVNRHLADVDEDTKTLEEVKMGLIQQYSNVESVSRELSDYFMGLLASEKIEPAKLLPSYQNEIQGFIRDIKTNAKQTLTRENELFLADPENEYLNFRQIYLEKARSIFASIDRRLALDQFNRADPDASNSYMPMMTQRISQDLLSSAMNFVRDMEMDGQYFLKEGYLAVAPQLPGIILRGRLNVDINYLLGAMKTGFIGKNKIDARHSIEPGGIPFEMVLEMKMGNKGIMSLDPKAVQLFDGDRRLRFDRSSKNSQFFLDFIKLYLAQTLAAMDMDLSEDTEDPKLKKEKKLKALGEYLATMGQGLVVGKDISEGLVNVMSYDIQKNPFSATTEDFKQAKGKILFSQLVDFDPQFKMLRLKVDPGVIMKEVTAGVQNTLQVWNIAPMVSKELNNTFLEIAVGNGPRGKKYVSSLSKKQDDPDNSAFSGLYNDNDRSSVDLLTSLNFRHLENYVNLILSEMIKTQNREAEIQLMRDEKQSHTLLDKLSISIKEDKRIVLELTATTVDKKEKWFSSYREEGWKIGRDSFNVLAELELKQLNLDDIRDELRDDKLPIYYNKEAIGLVINKAEFGKVGKPSLALSALSKLTNFNSSIGGVLRRLVLKIVSTYFNSQYKPNPKKKLLGHEIEEMVKVLTTKEEVVLLLNPRLAGAAFELKLAGKEKSVAQGIKIDSANQEVHVAFTAGSSMAKVDKHELIGVVKKTGNLIRDLLKINDKAVLVNEINNKLFVDKLVLDTDKNKAGPYAMLISTMKNYDQVINVANIPNANGNAEKRLSATGVELMYFASASFAFWQDLNQLMKKIVSMDVEDKILKYDALVQARNILDRNITAPLLKKYESGHRQINVKVLENPNTYWTYQFYADAFFSEKVYKMIKEGNR